MWISVLTDLNNCAELLKVFGEFTVYQTALNPFGIRFLQVLKPVQKIQLSCRSN